MWVNGLDSRSSTHGAGPSKFARQLIPSQSNESLNSLGTLSVEVVDWLALAAGKDDSSCPSEDRGAF